MLHKAVCFLLCRQVGTLHTYPPMKTEQTQCSETPAYKIQTPENCPEESIQHLRTRRKFETKNSLYTFLSKAKDFLYQTTDVRIHEMGKN